jgi:3-oxoacyl-[acyl-carrier protein] reductase
LAAGDKVATIDMSPLEDAKIFSVQGSVASSEDVNRAFDEIEEHQGRVEVLVANAGITRDGLLMRMSDEDFDSVISVNLAGTFRCCRRAVQSMVRQKYGRIIMLGSVVGLYGNAGQINYSSSKAALVGMARSITREVGSRNITANVIAPGFIDTAMTANLSEEVQKQYMASIPAARFGSVEDIAAVAEFLASDSASYVSGAVLPVDGGLGMGH